MSVRGNASPWVARAVYAGSAAGCCVLAATGHAHFVDLHVYRMGGGAALHGRDLYGLRFAGLPFTYPPFAAVVFGVLAAVPWAVAAGLLTAASAVALPAALYLALRLPRSDLPPSDLPPSDLPQRPGPLRLALVAGAAAIWLEPARTVLGYGQVDILLTAAVLYDLTRPDASRWKGLATGIAAGVKLTPAIFVGYLILTRRYRAAATAAVTFAGTVAAGFVVFPGGSAWYWAGTFARPSRVSPVGDAENQSLLGALTRTMHAENVLTLWVPLTIVVAVTGLALAAAAGRRGDEALGFSLCAITGLLVSPISWTHHWVIAIPALLLAGVAVYRGYRTGNTVTATFGAVGIMAIAAIGWTRIARHVPGSGELGLPGPALADSVVYVLAGFLALALAAYGRLRLGTPRSCTAAGTAADAAAGTATSTDRPAR